MGLGALLWLRRASRYDFVRVLSLIDGALEGVIQDGKVAGGGRGGEIVGEAGAGPSPNAETELGSQPDTKPKALLLLKPEATPLFKPVVSAFWDSIGRPLNVASPMVDQVSQRLSTALNGFQRL
jgi:hypothetical protein